VPVAVLGAHRVSNVVVGPIGADGTVRFASSVGTDVSVDVLAAVAALASTTGCASDGTGLRVSATTGAGPPSQLEGAAAGEPESAVARKGATAEESMVGEGSASAGRTASTDWGRTVEDFRVNGDAWRVESLPTLTKR
jgi:hypothetical protein